MSTKKRAYSPQQSDAGSDFSTSRRRCDAYETCSSLFSEDSTVAMLFDCASPDAGAYARGFVASDGEPSEDACFSGNSNSKRAADTGELAPSVDADLRAFYRKKGTINKMMSELSVATKSDFVLLLHVNSALHVLSSPLFRSEVDALTQSSGYLSFCSKSDISRTTITCAAAAQPTDAGPAHPVAQNVAKTDRVLADYKKQAQALRRRLASIDTKLGTFARAYDAKFALLVTAPSTYANRKLYRRQNTACFDDMLTMYFT